MYYRVSNGGTIPTLFNHVTSTGNLNTTISSSISSGKYYYLHFYMTGHGGGLATGNSTYTVTGCDVVYDANSDATKNYNRNAEYNALILATSDTVSVTQRNDGGSSARDWVANLKLYDI